MATREAVKVSGKSIAAFYARWAPGAVVECVDHTFRADSIGITATVTNSSNKSYIRMELIKDGKPVGSGLTPPKKVSDVVALTEDSITYRIWAGDDNTATWRIVTEAVR